MSGTWHEEPESKADEAERRVKYAALDSFSRYQRAAHYNVTHRRRQNFYALPQAHWQLLSQPPFSILEKLNLVDDAIEKNAKIANRIVQHTFDAFEIESDSDAWKGTAKSAEIDKARSTLRQFYRDWSAEGAVERQGCYEPVMAELERLFENVTERDQTKILVPGAGLGRLVVELCALGFDVEGNELSFHQLMASNWILNGTQPRESFDLHPWAFTFSNQLSREKQLRSVKIPDVHPGAYLHMSSEHKPRHAFERMGMSAADFCALYALPEHTATFGVVTTVYFIDTAPNLIRYLEAIRNVLEPGGYWVNLGPLLWHFEDRAPSTDNHAGDLPSGGVTSNSVSSTVGIEEAGAVELTVNEVRDLVVHMGFDVLKMEIKEQPQGYIEDTSSMITTTYKVLYFLAKKGN